MPKAEQICQDLDLYSSVASCSSGVELTQAQIVLLGNKAGAGGRYRIGHAVMKDALDIDGIYDAIRSAGLELPQRPRAEDLKGRVVNCFMKCEADRRGTLRGRRQIMLDDSDVHHAPPFQGRGRRRGRGGDRRSRRVRVGRRHASGPAGRRPGASPSSMPGSSAQPASPPRSAAAPSLARQSARELARLIRTRAVSPVEVLDAHLKVIERINPKLNAIVTLAADQARDAARHAETAVMKGEPLGPLHGLPFAIKDVTPTAGIRTTFASPLYPDHVPAEDAEVVRRLKAAGAIVLAKTNTPEFACGANTVNALFGADAQSVESRAQPGRLVGRLGGRGGDRHAAARAGHRFRLLDPHPRRLLRHCRDQADAGAHAQPPDAARMGPRPGPRSTRAQRRGCGADARCHGRL